LALCKALEAGTFEVYNVSERLSTFLRPGLDDLAIASTRLRLLEQHLATPRRDKAYRAGVLGEHGPVRWTARHPPN
jgi:hypothetical protein